MANPSISLTSYNMGDVTEADFDSWVAFVNERIDERCGFTVAVDGLRFGESGDDRISGSDEERETIAEAVRVLWDEWCAEGATGSA